jgi:hypothetical protein
MEGRCHYGRGNGGGVAQDVEAVLDTTASDRRRETKEEQAEWAAKAGWAG